MADPIKGATAPQPHPLDSNPAVHQLASSLMPPPLVDTITGRPVATASDLAPKRIEEIRATRRRRADDASDDFRAPLQVNKELLDPNFEYRFINDTGSRMHDLTVRDDWDIVRDPKIKDDNNNLGAEVRHQVGKNPDGSPIYARLCRKPKEFFAADRAKKQRRSDELEAALLRGQPRDKAAAALTEQSTYIPGGSNSTEVRTGTKVTTYKP